MTCQAEPGYRLAAYGSVDIVGSFRALRIWLNPEKVSPGLLFLAGLSMMLEGCISDMVEEENQVHQHEQIGSKLVEKEARH
jgi:hypothetical protein